MNQIISVRSNQTFVQEKSGTEFKLLPQLELVIIHTNGKVYNINKGKLLTGEKVEESRMWVSPELLQDLITELQLHQKTLMAMRHNADQINSLIKHLTPKEGSGTE